MSKHIRFYLVACVFALLASLSVWAQSTVTGAVGGVVTDPQKAVVPGAAVTVRNTGTNKESKTTTDSEGRFRASNLEPGTYLVTVNGSGFGEYTQDGVVVEVGRITSLNLELAVTAVSGNVEITAEAPVINTESKEFSTNVNQTSINELPINGRRWSNFAILTPGTVPDGSFGLISFRGISGLLNNNTIDGGDNNQAFFSEERGRTRISYSISQSAIREFQVNTSNYSAEYGRAAGGVINAVTKSGTNDFHGSFFYYQRNNRFGARNPLAFVSTFNPTTGAITRDGIKPEDIRHQTGGTIGGRIVKDKLFFFFSYDEQRRNFPGLGIFNSANYLTTVDTELLTTPLGTLLPARTGQSATQRLIGKGISTTEINQTLSFLNSLTGTVPRRGDQRLYLPKIDWNINSKNTFTATYNRLRWKSPAGIQTQATNTRGRASFGDDGVNIDSLNLRLSSTLAPTVLNEARFQYGRDNEFQSSQAPLPGEPTTAANGRSPDVFLTGGVEFGKPTFLERPAFPDEKRWQYADTVTVSRGAHTLKFGGDINHVRDLQDNLRNEAGAYSYANINEFIIDYVNFRFRALPRTGTSPSLTNTTLCSSVNNGSITVGGVITITPAARQVGQCYTSNYAQGFGRTRFDFSTTDYNAFVQDDWRASQRLTMNFGLRYEYQKLPSAFLANPLLPQTNNIPKDRNNFGPRVGFAYDLTGDGKTAIRGGYGIYFGRIINATLLNALINTGNANGQTQASLQSTNAVAPIFPNVLPSAPAGQFAVQYFAKNYGNPQIIQADLIFERQVARNTVVSASYLFSNGRHLPYFVDTNLNAPTQTRTFTISGGPFDGQTWNLPYFTGTRPDTRFAAITEIRGSVFSKYNALVLQANRRLTNGLQFQASYTLSKSTDNGQGSVAGANTNDPFNAFDQAAENSVSNFDRRHKFVVSAVYVTDFFKGNPVAHAIFSHFTLAPIFSAYSGAAVNGTINGSANTAATAFGPNTTGGLNGSGGSTRFAYVPRNFFRGPKIYNADMRISRRFRIKEGVNLEGLVEGFNIFNRTQVTGLDPQIYSVSGTSLVYRPTFLTTNEAGGTLFRERQVQFAARFEF